MQKSKIIWSTVLLFFSVSIAAEKCSEGLTYNGFSGQLTCGQTKLSPKELPELMKQVPEANEVYIKGKNLTKGGMAPAMIGAFGLGWGAGVSVFKGPLTPSAGPAFIIGAVGLSIGIPIIVAGSSKTKKAVDIYNNKIEAASLIPSLKLAGNSLTAVWDF